MESKTLAVFDGTLWFIRVGVAAALFMGAMSGTANSQPGTQYPRLKDATDITVKLVKRPTERKGRKLELVRESIGAVDDESL